MQKFVGLLRWLPSAEALKVKQRPLGLDLRGHVGLIPPIILIGTTTIPVPYYLISFTILPYYYVTISLYPCVTIRASKWQACETGSSR